MNHTTQAQEWLNTTAYPFKNHYVQLQPGKMHYIDEGQGEVLLFVHGTPTWSFLYRHFVKAFSKNYRCIAIDHIGFGLSEKPGNFDGTPQSHSKNLAEFIEKLNLQNFTLIVHDFGGPIGLSYAVGHPEKIKQIVLFNTWLWATKNNPAAQKVDKVINSWLGRFLYLRMNFSPKVLLKKGFADKSHLTKKIHQQYIKPFPNKTSRYSLLALAKSLVGASGWYQSQWEKLSSISSKPWLILWGTKDSFITTEYLEKWQQRLPDAEVHQFGCGHFVQEEKTEEAIKFMAEFLPKPW